MLTSSARRALSLGAALLLLLAVVGLAARGHLPGSSGARARTVSGDIVLEYVLLLLLLAALVVVPVVVMAFRQTREELDTLPRRGNWMLRLFVVMTLIAAVVAVRIIFLLHHHHGQSTPSDNPLSGLGKKIPKVPTTSGEPHFDWVPVIVVLSLAVAGAAVGAYVVRTRRPRASTGARVALALSNALDESLDDLRRERDARRAVIAAYARMERVLAASGLPRRAPEAPLEYLGRVLRELLRASASSVTRLTDLFERAKFSHHEVDPEMKEEAIAALVAIRDELREYA